MVTKKTESDMIYTKYELAQMVGVRALQISMGAPFAIKLSAKELEALNYNPISIAKIELEKGAIPLRVLRPESVAPSLMWVGFSFFLWFLHWVHTLMRCIDAMKN